MPGSIRNNILNDVYHIAGNVSNTIEMWAVMSNNIRIAVTISTKRVHLNGFCIDKREIKIICAISIENLKRLFILYLK